MRGPGGVGPDEGRGPDAGGGPDDTEDDGGGGGGRWFCAGGMCLPRPPGPI